MVKVEQLFTGCLAQAAYLVVSGKEAAVIDPLRETQPYVALAAQHGASIKYVLETHFHADFVSGHCDLAAATGATIVYGPTAAPGFQAKVAYDGESLKVGSATIVVLHTPGHTMESVSYLLQDEDGKMQCIFTGDTLFLGDVGRPDLAQRAVSMTQEELAALLYRSLRTKIMPLPDELVVYPGHGAGSECGKNISSASHDTLGNQKRTNYALREGMTESEFVAEVTRGLSAPPEYFGGNVAKNKVFGGVSFDEILQRGHKALSVNEIVAALSESPKPLLVDTREMSEFIKGHIPGSVFCGLNGGFAPWMGTAFPQLDRPILIVAQSDEKVAEVITRLSRTGFDNVRGYLAGGVAAWQASGHQLESVNVVTADDLAKLLDSNAPLNLIDVRKPGEVHHVKCTAAQHFPLGGSTMKRIPQDKDIYVFCHAGYRALICESALKSDLGFRGNVSIIEDGLLGLKRSEAFKKYLVS